MIPNLRMGYFHKREYLGVEYNIQMGETLPKKPLKTSMNGFEYSSLLTSKTYSILSYIVGGFVGSKSQMNYNKHKLSYDLSAAIFNLLNPCKFEKEKNYRKNNENFHLTATVSTSPDDYEKYIVKSSQKEKMIDLELELLQNYMLGFKEECYNSSRAKESSADCDDKVSSDSQINKNNCEVEDCLNRSVDMTDRVTICGVETSEGKNFKPTVGSLATERFRQLSECSVESTDSESFIVFDGPELLEDEKKSEENWKLENFDFDSDIENDYNDDDDDDDDDDEDGGGDDENYDYYDNSICCDDYEICLIERELEEANDKWERNYEGVEAIGDEEQRKVRFNDNVKVNKMVAWDFAYRAARPGPWEQMARDRVRFRERILRLSPTISAVLKKEHRDKVYKELYS